MMLPRPLRLSPKTKAVLAVALALLLWVPQGVSTETQPVVTGHSTFYNGDSYDPCLASIAGIVRSRVMWFNDQVLVERYPGKGTAVYVTEHGAEDPSDGHLTLFTDGVSYNFVDPNGAAWHVDEAYSTTAEYGISGSTKVGVPPSTTDKQSPVYEDKTYVWIVELAAQPIFDQFPGGDAHQYYNFLDVVDTCKFHNSTATYAGVTPHSTGLGPSNGHETGAVAHTHEVWNADIYLGKLPALVPRVLSQETADYETTWAESVTTGGST